MAFSDEDIIGIIRCDKEVGIQKLFDRYYRMLVLYADEYLQDIVAAEDLVQELFIKLWVSDHLLESVDSSLSSYLYVAVKNSCYTYSQKKDVLRNTEEINHIDIHAETLVDIDEERINQVMLAVQELPQRTRQVVETVMIRRLKYREAADELGISVNTVKFLLKEGIKRLRTHFSSKDKMFLFFFLKSQQKNKFP